MSAQFKRVGQKVTYDFVDEKCIGRKCFAPGEFQHRAGAGMGMGSRATGHYSKCCMNRAYHGCPEGPVGERREFDNDLGCEVIFVGLPEIDPGLIKERKSLGWRKA